MEPLPETEQALDEFSTYGVDLRSLLLEMGKRAEAIVPSLVGLSLGLVQEGVTFTLVSPAERREHPDGPDGPAAAAGAATDRADLADRADRAGLVPKQRGGRCDDSDEPEVGDALDERSWSAYARTTASDGVRTTLSLPVVKGTRVVGDVNLYATTLDAFVGHHQELGAALGASAEGAVTDADLAFSTRDDAVTAPAATAELRDVDLALGMVSARDGIDIPAARAQLETLALRSGVSLVAAARLVRHFLRP